MPTELATNLVVLRLAISCSCQVATARNRGIMEGKTGTFGSGYARLGFVQFREDLFSVLSQIGRALYEVRR